MDLYNQLLDKTIILRINQHFYEQVYAHPWLSLYFQAVTKEFITQQQTDFIVGAIGGPKLFCGRLPSNAHPHMFITDELFDLRKAMLQRSFQELKAPYELEEAWLRIDEAFRRVIVKNSIEDCKGRWPTDEILDFKDPGQELATPPTNSTSWRDQ